MRFGAVALLMLAALATAGCTGDCTFYTRVVVWQQELDVPDDVDFELGNTTGTLWRSIDDGRLHLQVVQRDPVSKDEATEFANALFAAQGWPPPDLSQADINEAHCPEV